MRLLFLVFAVLVGCADENPQSLVASGREYLSKGDTKAAVVQLKNALQKSPDLAEARFLLAKALYESHDPVGAGVELRKANDLRYASDQVVPLFAKVLLEQGQTKQVTDQYAKMRFASAESTADLQTSVAIAYAAQGNQRNAQEALAAAFAVVPDYVPALVVQGRLQAAGREPDAAFKTVERALALAPSDPAVLQLKGDLLTQVVGDTAAAIDVFERAAKSKKDAFAPHASLVAIYLSQGNIAAAKPHLDAMRMERPGHASVAFFDAEIEFRQGNLKTARQTLQQLMKVAPDNPKILQLAGAVELKDNSLLTAEQFLRKALQASPDLFGVRSMLAQIQIKLSRPEKALELLEPLLKWPAPPARALSLAATAYLQQGNGVRAEELFTRAVQADPQDKASRTALAVSALAAGKRDEEPTAELRAIAASEAAPVADVALISAQLRRHDFDAAMKAVDALEQKQPGKPLASSMRGRVLLLSGDEQRARQSFERSLSIDPKFFPAVSSLASLDMKDKRPADAQRRFENLLKEDPRSTPGLLALAQLRDMTGGSKEEVAALLSKAVSSAPSSAEPRLLLINFYLNKRDFKLAASAAQEATAALPEHAGILHALGVSQVMAGDANQAISSFTRLAALLPESPQPLLMLADAQSLMRNDAAALQTLERASELAPGLLAADERTIAIHMRARRMKEALVVAKRVQQSLAGEPIGFVMEGDIEASTKNWGAAVAAYRAAMKKHEASAIAEKLHGALRNGSKRGEAEAFASTWMRRFPQDAHFISHLANYALVDKDFASAEEKLLRVVKLQPDNAVALNNVAWVMHQLKRPDAVRYAERANQVRPREPMFMDTWATILAADGKVAQAIELERQAVELQPANHLLRFNLAKLYLKGGDKSAARIELDRLTKVGEKLPFLREVQQLLATS